MYTCRSYTVIRCLETSAVRSIRCRIKCVDIDVDVEVAIKNPDATFSGQAAGTPYTVS